MAIQQDWKISRRNNKCFHSKVKFADGEPFYTCIFEDPESEGFLRKDFSEAVWKELGATLEPFSFWRSTCKYPPVEEESTVMENESAESMLRRMVEEDDASTENARYILALMLERKKNLHPVGVKETESSRLLLYEHRATGDVLIIRDPQLRLAEVEQVQEEVSRLLDQKIIPLPPQADLPDAGDDPALDDTATIEGENPETDG
jgi:hypothetical protein